MWLAIVAQSGRRLNEMREMNELEKAFDDAVMNAVTEGARLGYSAIVYLQMRAKDGPIETARRLMKDKRIPYGLRKLKELRRLDLTLEATVYKNPRFQALFTQAIVEHCKEKLTALDYFEKERKFPPLPKMDWNRR
jgi:hypothetical protein